MKAYADTTMASVSDNGGPSQSSSSSTQSPTTTSSCRAQHRRKPQRAACVDGCPARGSRDHTICKTVISNGSLSSSSSSSGSASRGPVPRRRPAGPAPMTIPRTTRDVVASMENSPAGKRAATQSHGRSWSHASLGHFGILPDGLLSGELLRRMPQKDLAALSMTSHALRAAVRPLLARALRCSYCRSHLLHPRDLSRAVPPQPTLFVVGAWLPPTAVARSARVFCAECKANIGKIVAVSPQAPPVIALEKGPVRLVNSENEVVGLDGIAAPHLPMRCAECGYALGNAAEDLLYSTRRAMVQYFCCYALDGTAPVGEKRITTDERWGSVRTEKICCKGCGTYVGYKYCGRVLSSGQNMGSVTIDDSADEQEYDDFVLDDVGNLFYAFLQCDRVRRTPNLAYSFPGGL